MRTLHDIAHDQQLNTGGIRCAGRRLQGRTLLGD